MKTGYQPMKIIKCFTRVVLTIVLLFILNLKVGGGEKMQDNTIMLIMGFITTMIPIFTVIVKLNNTITKLNVTIQVLSDQMQKGQEDRNKIHNQLNNHETRISILENERRER